MNVLITGNNGYVGNRLKKWLKNRHDFNVDTVGVRDNEWEKLDLSFYDAIVHAAGIAHMKETKENKSLYYEINRDLTIKLAQKAKRDGVPHFIFMSSMSVYGIETGVIDRNTTPKPKSNYGISKLEAEKSLMTMINRSFTVSIIRPPMIYGKDSKGNYAKLSMIVKKLPIFPNIQNERSMLFIDNLNEFIASITREPISGYFHPQNESYVCTTDMVREISTIHNKSILFTKIFNPIINIINNPILDKMFGSLIYSKDIDLKKKHNEYNIISFSESIKLTEEKK
ncbi:NAD-dependent epimerase/dehydratase family protein [Salisediminibacterium beveridgei]|uniref:UDP-glucose 4-epimerase n=1 Tax=Salisediminibacterium beveridgei TaxID=632773 RepID=A0A1D7QRM6_9BACI|nr:NAD-dependent epimerase/dehydratase family protein [Salisediminibacterium beveridgei]AOM81651.1 UDP-glucose 4-epimerase [Salisediminibacterium beveridgei]